jgi:hypothetical protein
MIFGNNGSISVIAAKNMVGYDIFLTSDFTKEFTNGESVSFYYPPEHPNANQKYQFGLVNGSKTTTPCTMSSEDTRTINSEDQELKLLRDFIYPYQTSLFLGMNQNTSSILPLSDDGMSGGSGYDGFLLKGSVIYGESSGAKRYYAGPFKGYSKEIESVCQGTTAMNIMDGSDCLGWLKGSVYENGYDSKYHDLFSYPDEPKQKVDHRFPYNRFFMQNTPFADLNYSWLNVPNRKNRPIPYNMLGTSNKGTYAALITRKHALVLNSRDVAPENLVFYSLSQGLTSVAVSSSVNTFKEMWDAIGFVNENSNATTLENFNALSAYFNNIKILTLSSELPSDVTPISLYDNYGSDKVLYSMVFDQEGRGHHSAFCPPLTKDSISGTSDIRLDTNNTCNVISESMAFPTALSNTTTAKIMSGDIGSPVITYSDSVPVLMGFLSSYDNVDDAVIGTTTGLEIGSTKLYTFPWGYSYSPISILNLYLGLGGCQANSHQIHERTIDQYPYPNGQNSIVNSDFNSLITTFRSLFGARDIDITDYGEEVDGRVRDAVREMECFGKYWMAMVECNIKMLGAKGCECDRYSQERTACSAIQLYFCADKLCDMMRRVYRDIIRMPLDLECPSVWDKDAWETYKKMGQFVMFTATALGLNNITLCEYYRLVKGGGLDYCNNNTPSIGCNGEATTPILPPSQACDAFMEANCPPPGPQVFHDDFYSRLMGCYLGRYVSSGGEQTEEWHRTTLAECARINCPGGGLNGTDPGCPNISCDELVLAITTGQLPKRCVGKHPITNNKLPLVGPYDDQGPISPVPENCEIPEP